MTFALTARVGRGAGLGHLDALCADADLRAGRLALQIAHLLLLIVRERACGRVARFFPSFSR